jgi:hypothetical protein
VDHLLRRGLRQPDRRSCGAATLVMARMLRDPAYAEHAAAHFPAEALAMHRRVTGPVDVRGRLQPPWPRALGTPPWAVARQLAWTAGTAYDVDLVRWSRDRGLATLEAGVDTGLPVALYVGSRTLPRHVVLALAGPDGGVRAWEPSSGRTADVEPEALRGGRLRGLGWPRAWFVVAPRAAGRRTRA